MHSIIIAIIITFVAAQDRIPSGGANCTKSSDCGLTGGLCEEQIIGNVTMKGCVCFPQYGAADCSYQRYNKIVVAGLQIGLPFISIDGVGWLLMGERDHGLAQLLMGLSLWLIIIPLACLTCCCACTKSIDADPESAAARTSIGKGIGGCLYCIACSIMFAAWAWSIADGVRMLNDPNFRDPRGFALY